jgi:hypothetical protein
MTTEEQGSEEDRATVTATLLRLGFLSGEEDPEEDAYQGEPSSKST